MGRFVIFGKENDDAESIVETRAGKQDSPAFGGPLKILEMLLHDDIFFRCGLFEKTITIRMDEIKIFRHG
jgi:hypothetical protein